MVSEWLVILIVALVAFGPKRLPMLASHLYKAWMQLQACKQQLLQFWQKQWLEQQLLENQKRAEEADKAYED